MRPPGIPSNYVQVGPDQWAHPSRAGVGQLPGAIAQPETRPLEQASPAKKTGRKRLAGVRPQFRICLVSFRHREIDDDNLAGGCKPIRDAIAAWLGLDDNQDVIRWEYDQHQTHGAEGTTVTIERLT